MAPKVAKSEKASIDLELLIKIRSKLKANILRIKTAIVEKTISFDSCEIECRLDMLNNYVKEVMEIQSQIELIDDDDAERGNVEDLCVTTKSKLMSLLKKPDKKKDLNETFFEKSFNQIDSVSRTRLPSMPLPKFNGKYSDFKNFISLFENLVDSDSSIPEIAKFNHLLSCLSGEALGTIKAYQVSGENYQKALASLKKVYDNSCLIFLENISQLFELPQISKPSASELRSMIDTVSAVYDSLLSLGDDRNITNAFIIHIVMSKVDNTTRYKYEEQINYDKLPLWADCADVLNRRYQHLAADESCNSKRNIAKLETKKVTKNALVSVPKALKKGDQKLACFFCNSDHNITACPSFSAIPVHERFDFAKKTSLCINCLRKGHTSSKCKSIKCRVCNQTHNILLHRYTPDQSQNTAVADSGVYFSNVSGSNDHVILATAIVKVKNNCGEYCFARALLDSGSQLNLMTEDFANKINIDRERCNLELSGVGKTNIKVRSKVNASVKSRVNEYEVMADCWVLKSITSSQPGRKIDVSDLNIPNNLDLADPLFFRPQKIDLLLGAGIFFELFCNGQIKLANSGPVIQKTLFGWIVSGTCKQTANFTSLSCNFIEDKESLVSIDATLKKFWTMEELPGESTNKKFLTPEQKSCEDHFVKNTTLTSLKKFEVSLPFKSSPETLGSSYETAKRRFLALEKRLEKNSELKCMYLDFMKEYVDLGHMSPTNNTIPNTSHYFIPHQCVIRPQSTTTKLRVVFDASCKSSTRKSLNDILMVGPTIQEDLFSTLLRFRLHKYAITADITKMYRQILVNSKDRIFQLIVWREHQSDPLQIFQLNTVTYGTGPAPFLAIRCLKLLGDLNENLHPTGANVIRSDFYVDDLLTGADDFEKLSRIYDEVNCILQSAGFSLAKWFSNHPKFALDDRAEKALQFNTSDATKTLGLIWVPEEDHFKFNLELDFLELKATKRNILSVAARLFDPLGLLCPLVTKAKILLQELWIQKLDWDESIPLSLDTYWQKFKENLLKLPEISVPRFVFTSTNSSIQIHGFADASMRAYGCCLYVRSVSADGIKTTILTAKSKVAPLRTKSLPRLELCAAHLLAKLWKVVAPMLSQKPEKVVFWTDSEITLHWIKTHPSILTVFVANRVSEIQEWSENIYWRHVPTKQNPADIVSRGSDIEELKSSIWFNGPEFLKLMEIQWPINEHFKLTEEDEKLEKKSKIVVMIANIEIENRITDLSDNISSYPKLIRVLAYVLRFVSRLRKIVVPSTYVISSEERQSAFLKFVEIIQHVEFSDEIKYLKENKPLSNNIQKLNPFIDEFTLNNEHFSLLRVGGRLLNAPIEYDAKFPLLLTKNSHFIKSYLRYLHIRNCHAGPKALISLLRQKIWLVNARQACTKTVHDCIHCFRYKPKLLTQIMGNLPADRLIASRPFLVCGVDFCGPVFTSLKIRGRPPYKSYVAIYVCFTSKAVHIELVGDLSTDCFLLSLKRFIARRGVPKVMYSDNATNFVGAHRKLEELRMKYADEAQKIETYAAEEGFRFEFIPPRAPHFGGIWEAAVKSAKNLLVRTIGSAMLTAEELTTILAEIEAVLNSRPIAPLSSDPNDGEALTPAHLLIGGSLRSIPDCKVPLKDLSGLKRWQLVSTLKQKFWEKWSRDYLVGLQTRNKWLREERNLEKGELVVVHEDNVAPQKWIMGRVLETVAGKDGKVRVASIRTQNGVISRAIHKLALLPLEY